MDDALMGKIAALITWDRQPTNVVILAGDEHYALSLMGRLAAHEIQADLLTAQTDRVLDDDNIHDDTHDQDHNPRLHIVLNQEVIHVPEKVLYLVQAHGGQHAVCHVEAVVHLDVVIHLTASRSGASTT